MATEKQKAANKQNAQKSTGPKTEEGKAVCRANALKHGLAAKELTFEGDFSEDYDLHVQSWCEEFVEAKTASEWSLLRRIIQADWRLRRHSRGLTDSWEHRPTLREGSFSIGVMEQTELNVLRLTTGLDRMINRNVKLLREEIDNRKLREQTQYELEAAEKERELNAKQQWWFRFRTDPTFRLEMLRKARSLNQDMPEYHKQELAGGLDAVQQACLRNRMYMDSGIGDPADPEIEFSTIHFQTPFEVMMLRIIKATHLKMHVPSPQKKSA